MFSILMFSLLAVLLVVAGVTVLSRNRAQLNAEDRQRGTTSAARRERRAKRAQSRHDRRKRH
jgi:hypothetical protein